MVGNILRLMLGRGLSIIRWNNFPRVIDIKHMDNVGFTLHVALFLAYQEERLSTGFSGQAQEGQNKSQEGQKNQEGQTTAQEGQSQVGEGQGQIDRLFLMKKIIFTSLADLILSDINSGTKGYIKKADSQIFSELYQKAFSHIYAFEGPDFLREDMQQTLEDTSHPLEEKLFLAAKKYVGFFESQTNARVFPEMYEVPIGEIGQSLEQLSAELPSLKFLMSDTRSQKYLSHIQRLSFAMRWNQYQRNTPISVMSHKVVVAYFAYVIGMHLNQQGEHNDITEMMMRAMYHDVPEVITGDIITPTKKAVPGFVELLEKVETDMVEDYLFSYISPEYKTYISNYMLVPFNGEVGKRVKYADNLSALFEAKLEVVQGNKNFTEVAKKMLSDISQENNPAVEYILKDMVLYFEEIREDILK